MSRPYKIEIVETMEDRKRLAKELEENLRDVDRREIEGMGFSVHQGVESSICDDLPVYVGRAADTGALVCCWGLQEIYCHYIIWALGTDEMEHFKRPFVMESKKIIDKWLDKYGCLGNTVACFNRRAIRWLKSLGAEFMPPRKIGIVDYMDFRIVKKEEK